MVSDARIDTPETRADNHRRPYSNLLDLIAAVSEYVKSPSSMKAYVSRPLNILSPAPLTIEVKLLFPDSYLRGNLISILRLLNPYLPHSLI